MTCHNGRREPPRRRWCPSCQAANLARSQLFRLRGRPSKAPRGPAVNLVHRHSRRVNSPNFDKMELIPVIAQDDATGDVLMLAYMNRAAYEETLATGRVCYFSRSRNKLWR